MNSFLNGMIAIQVMCNEMKTAGIVKQVKVCPPMADPAMMKLRERV
jgi:hypothetical protein